MIKRKLKTHRIFSDSVSDRHYPTCTAVAFFKL